MPFLRRWLPFFLWAAVILSAAHDSLSIHETGSWFRTLFGRDVPDLLHITVRKASHVTEYAILGLLAWHGRRGLLVPIVLALAVAIADESLQSFTAERTGMAADVVLDTCSAALAVAVVQRFRARPQKERMIPPPC